MRKVINALLLAVASAGLFIRTIAPFEWVLPLVFLCVGMLVIINVLVKRQGNKEGNKGSGSD